MAEMLAFLLSSLNSKREQTRHYPVWFTKLSTTYVVYYCQPCLWRRLPDQGQRKAARWRTKSPALNRSCTKARLCSKLPWKLSSPARSNRRRMPTTMRGRTSLTTMTVLPARSHRRLAVCVAGSVPDSHVFGPPWSGSISQRYGSGSFYHQAKIVRKTSIPTVLRLLLDFLFCKNYGNIPLKGKKTETKMAGSGSVSQRHGSADPDPHQHVTDPERWLTQVWENLCHKDWPGAPRAFQTFRLWQRSVHVRGLPARVRLAPGPVQPRARRPHRAAAHLLASRLRQAVHERARPARPRELSHAGALLSVSGLWGHVPI